MKDINAVIKNMIFKSNINLKDKAHILLFGLVSAFLSNNVYAMDLFIKENIASVAKTNPDLAKSLVAQTGIGAEVLFPPHWDAFFKHCDTLDYAGTVNAMTALAQGTLNQPFAQQVKSDLGNFGNNIVVAGNNLSAWIEAAQTEIFREKLKIFPEYQKKFNKYKAAVKVHETLNGVDPNACIPTYNLIAASPNCDKALREAYKESLGNVNHKNRPITDAIVTKVIDGHQNRANAVRDAKIEIECQDLTNLGVPPNIALPTAQAIILNNVLPAPALAHQLRLSGIVIALGGQDIIDNVAQKIVQSNQNYVRLTQLANDIQGALGGLDNLACVPVFNALAVTNDKTIKKTYEEHIRNQEYSSNINRTTHVLTGAIATKVIDGRQTRADAERDAMIDVERKILTTLGVPENQAQATAQMIVINHTRPSTALMNHLTAVLVDGQDITADVAIRVTQGVTLADATLYAKISKYTQILKSKGYGFDDKTCEMLATELVSGKTLEQACQDKLPIIHCAGKQIQAIVYDQMIRMGISFDKALEQVSFDTHFEHLKQANINKKLGLPAGLLQQAAEKITKKQCDTYEKALVASSAPILFGWEGKNIDITQDVFKYVFRQDTPHESLVKATNLAKIDCLASIYFQKPLQLSLVETKAIGIGIIEENLTLIEAIAKSLQLKDNLHRNELLSQAVAQKIAANIGKDAAIHEVKVAIDEKYFTDLKIDLTQAQIKTIAAQTAKGVDDVEALSSAILPIRENKIDLTSLVANSMITQKVNYDTASKFVKIDFFQAQIRDNTKELDEPTMKNAATLFVEKGLLSLPHALAQQLPACFYDGQDLRLEIANRMFQKINLADASKSIWLAAATKDVQASCPKLTEYVNVLVEDMLTQKHTKQQALEALVAKHRLFAKSSHTAQVAAAEHVLKHKASIDDAWEVVCLNPVKERLKNNYANFDEDIAIFMSQSIARDGLTDIAALLSCLGEKYDLNLTFCDDNVMIAKVMLAGNLSLKQAVEKAEKDVIRSQLAQKGGWSCLKEKFEELVNVCYISKSIEVGEETYIYSRTNFEPHLVKLFLPQVKFANHPFEEVKETFIRQTVIRDLLIKHYPNLDNNEVIIWIVEQISKNKVKAEQFSNTKQLDENTLRGALQTKAQVLYGKNVNQNLALEMARTLLSRKDLTIGQVYTNVLIDQQAKLFKQQQGHLSEAECRELAAVCMEIKSNKIQDAIAFIFKMKGYDTEDIMVIEAAIIDDKLSFDKAEGKVDFRQLMAYYSYLSEPEAREMADLKKQKTIDPAKPIEGYLQYKFKLKADIAHIAYDFLKERKAKSLEHAAEKAEYICDFESRLRNKSFFKQNDLNGDEVWMIACAAFDNDQNELDAFTQFLRQKKRLAHPSITDDTISDAYVACLVKMLLNDDMAMNDAIAEMMHMEEQLAGRVLDVFFFDPHRDNQLLYHQQIQQWDQIFGADSLSPIVAVMCYVNNADINKIDTFESLTPQLQKAVPIFLQSRHMHDLHQHPIQIFREKERVKKWPLSSTVYVIDEDALLNKFCELIVDGMIQHKKSYQESLRVLTERIMQERRKFLTQFPYLQDSHIFEIAENAFYLQNDKQQQAIYRFLCENSAYYLSHMSTLGIKVDGLLEDEWQAYFENFAEVLSFKAQGQDLWDTFRDYRKSHTALEQKMVQRFGRALRVPVPSCVDLVWNVSICKRKEFICEWLGQVLFNNLATLNVPAIMLGKEYISNRDYKEICESVDHIHPTLDVDQRNKMIVTRMQQKACEKIAALFGLEKLTDKFPFEDEPDDKLSIFEKMLHRGLKMFIETRDSFHNPLALPLDMIREFSTDLATEVIVTPNVRKLSGAEQFGHLAQRKAQVVEKAVLSKAALFRDITLFADAFHNIGPIATIMINDRLSLAQAVCKFVGRDVKAIPDFSIINTLGNLLFLDINSDHFDLPNFDLTPQNLMLVAKTLLSKDEDVDVFEYSDGREIACLYRQVHKLLPIRVLKGLQAQYDDLTRIQGKLKQKWITFIQQMSTPRYEFGWNKHPYNPVFQNEVVDLTNHFYASQLTKEVRINLSNLRHDPWFVESPYDKIADVTDTQYKGMRDIIMGNVLTYLRFAAITTDQQTNRLVHRIGRFFAWGHIDDSYNKEYLNQYLGWQNQIIQEQILSGEERKSWRKRVKVVCDNLILIGNPTAKDVFDRCPEMYEPEIDGCILGSKSALAAMEKKLPPVDELSLFNKIFTCLNNWKIDKLNALVKKQIKSEMVENEYCSFAKFICKNTLSVFMNEGEMHNHATLFINEGTGLYIKPLITEFLQCYHNEITTIVMNNISCKAKPEKDRSHTIFLSEIEEWAEDHPVYCNLLLLDPARILTEKVKVVDERTKQQVDALKVKDVVVQRLLKSAGYIDWDDKEK